MRREIYLDNSATTKPYDEVIDSMSEINRNFYGNPSSLHTKGIEAEKLIKKARESVAVSLKVEEREIVFTSGGTESNNLAIGGYLEANPRKGKHIITTRIEHPSVLEVVKNLALKGYTVDYLNVDKVGFIDLDQLKGLITKDTAIISIILINNEIGTMQPIEEIVRIKNNINKEAVIHVDAVQAYGKQVIQPKKIGIDLMTLSSHKIHGPKGVGALFVNRNVRLKPILLGGGQESLLRSGTENVSGISGFGLAAEYIYKSLEHTHESVKQLKDLFIEKLPEYVEEYQIISPDHSSPYILNLSFLGVRAEVLLHHLEERNIFVSTGAACSSRKNVHSHVLTAVGHEAGVIEGAIRMSFGEFNTNEDILETLAALKEIIPRIKSKGTVRKK